MLGMTFSELAILLNHINQHNTMLSRGTAPVVKYVHPNLDMRTSTVFSITFRGYGTAAILFHTQNECSRLDKSLFDRCMDYLLTGDIATASISDD